MNLKLSNLLIITGLCLVLNAPSRADDTSDIKQYIKNFGGHLGYDLTSAASPPPPTAAYDVNDITAIGKSAVSDFVSTIPIANGLIGDLSNSFTAINDLLKQTPNPNWIFNNFSSESDSTISANKYVDQQPYQTDPVSQAVFNLTSTPDVTYCTDSGDTTTAPNPNCNFVHSYKVMQNVLGYSSKGEGVPSLDDFVKGTAIKEILPDLNPNSLLGPLIYNTSSPGSASTTASPTSSGGAGGPAPMKGSNQLKQANNFILYASNLVNPMPLADFKTYTSVVVNTIQNPAIKPQDKLTAAASLLNYMTNLRSYAAQVSVGISNFYYIMAKRIKNPGSGTSAAYDEFIMATRRLYNPDNSNANAKNKWIENMEKAAPAQVQREQLYLLADINYQLYLERMQNERILMTLSTLLLQSANTTRSTITLQSNDINSQMPGIKK